MSKIGAVSKRYFVGDLWGVRSNRTSDNVGIAQSGRAMVRKTLIDFCPIDLKTQVDIRLKRKD